jgi:hypothetical protein
MSIGFRGRLVASSLVIAMQAALTVVHPAGATSRPDAVTVRPVPLPQYLVGLAVDPGAGHLVTVICWLYCWGACSYGRLVGLFLLA